MSSTVSDPPRPDHSPVTLAGLFTTAAQFLTAFRHPEVHDDLSFVCHRGRLQIQVLEHAGDALARRDLLNEVAALIEATPHAHEHTHNGADMSIWGTYTAYGHFMETPVFAWTAVAPTEAARLGWGSMANVIELPLPDGQSGGAR